MSIMLVLIGLAGGGLYTNVTVNLTHCTFARNLCGAEDGVGSVYHAAGGSTIKNSILWRNEAGSPPQRRGRPDQGRRRNSDRDVDVRAAY